MIKEELQAKIIADTWVGHVKQIDKLKKLGEELVEFTDAVLTEGEDEMLEEAGDMCFLILHILSNRIPVDKINLVDLVTAAARKMEIRNQRKNELSKARMSIPDKLNQFLKENELQEKWKGFLKENRDFNDKLKK